MALDSSKIYLFLNVLKNPVILDIWMLKVPHPQTKVCGFLQHASVGGTANIGLLYRHRHFDTSNFLEVAVQKFVIVNKFLVPLQIYRNTTPI